MQNVIRIRKLVPVIGIVMACAWFWFVFFCATYESSYVSNSPKESFFRVVCILIGLAGGSHTLHEALRLGVWTQMDEFGVRQKTVGKKRTFAWSDVTSIEAIGYAVHIKTEDDLISIGPAWCKNWSEVFQFMKRHTSPEVFKIPEAHAKIF